MTRCTMAKCCLSYMYICHFLFSVTNSHAILSSKFCCSHTSGMSSSFHIAVLGGVFRLVLGFCIFNGCARDHLCMNFTILPFDQRMIPYFIYHACLFSEKSV